MKKLLLTVVIVFSCAFLLNASSMVKLDGDPTKIPSPSGDEIKKGGKAKGNERSEQSDAFVKIYSGTVFVDLFETGPTIVFLVDSFGQVVSSVVSVGLEYESLSLPLPSSKGSYTLVIWGTYYYGEWTLY